MLLILMKLFNINFEAGIVQKLWWVGVICPISKTKGDVVNPDNYRGISILSCYGKLFFCILNIENINVLCKEQAG